MYTWLHLRSRQDVGVTAWPAGKHWPWDPGDVEWFEGSYWSQPGRRLANSLSKKRLEIWDQRFSSGSTLEGWSWHLWQASSRAWMATWASTWASSTGDDFAIFCGLQWSCCTLAPEWRMLSGKRTWTEAKAWKAAFGSGRREICLACVWGHGGVRGLLLQLFACPRIGGLGVVFRKCRGSCYSDSLSCFREPCPAVCIQLHDCHHHVVPNGDGHQPWQRSWWKQNTIVKGFVGTIPVPSRLDDQWCLFFGACINGCVCSGCRKSVRGLGRWGLHMAHSLPLVHSMLLLYLLFLCTLRLPGAIVNQGSTFPRFAKGLPATHWSSTATWFQIVPKPACARGRANMNPPGKP